MATSDAMATSNTDVCRRVAGFTLKGLGEQSQTSVSEISALGELPHLGGGHIRRLRVIELFQRLDPRQMRFFDSVGDGVSFPLFQLRGQ